jgi:hypothetical protein
MQETRIQLIALCTCYWDLYFRPVIGENVRVYRWLVPLGLAVVRLLEVTQIILINDPTIPIDSDRVPTLHKFTYELHDFSGLKSGHIKPVAIIICSMIDQSQTSSKIRDL